jgi:hypothetical protein
MAELLKARGYRTSAYLGAYVLDAKWGRDALERRSRTRRAGSAGRAEGNG